MTDRRLGEIEAVAARHVSRETFDRLLEFERQFRRWAARINLASDSTLNDAWSRHILDSAQLLRYAPVAKNWVDIGSGGGFPGAILAILLGDEKDARMSLIESNQKKASYLRSVLAELAPNALVIARRAEDVVAQAQAPNIITARAVTSLSGLLSLTERWLRDGARGLFHKGRDYGEELKLANDTWNLDLVIHPSMVGTGSVVLDVRSARRM